MKILHAALAATLAITCICPSQAAVAIASPSHGQTRSDSSVSSQGLHWNARRRALTAVITFSNVNYTLQADPRENDTFAFVLPGVRYDRASNVFYAISKDGRRTPIATFKSVLFGRKIELLPSATIYADNDHGNITVRLLARDRSTSTPRWAEAGGSPRLP